MSYKFNDMFSISLEGQNLPDKAQACSINGNPMLSQGHCGYGRSVNLSPSFRF